MDSFGVAKKRFLGRIPVSSVVKENNAGITRKGSPLTEKVQNDGMSFNSTFGGEFNDELLCEVEKLECDLEGTNSNHKNNTLQTCNDNSSKKRQTILSDQERTSSTEQNAQLTKSNSKQSKSNVLTECSNLKPKIISSKDCLKSNSSKDKDQNVCLLKSDDKALNLNDLSLNSPVHISTPTDAFRRIHESRISKLTNSQAHDVTLSQLRVKSQKDNAIKHRYCQNKDVSKKSKSVNTEGNSVEKGLVTQGNHHQMKKNKNNAVSNSKQNCLESDILEGDLNNGRKNVETEPTLTPRPHGSGQECEDRLLLSSWGLPDVVLNKYAAVGITQMFHWQADCLCTGKVLEGGNLVYSAPTSAGKTMVAELLMLKRVLETRKKAIMILPFVSVAREKMFYLQNMLSDAGIRVDGYMGSQNPSGGFSAVDIAICTIEKANSLVNRLLDEGHIDTLGIIVVDELHMVGDAHRGYLLELLLTKIRFMTIKMDQKAVQDDESEAVMTNTIQVIGMSATLPNLDLLADWLDADLYHTDYRPVPLREMVKIGVNIYDSDLSKLRSLETKLSFKGDDEHIIPLCLETICIGCSVLIFCPTKNWCEKLADSIAREFFFLQKDASNETPKLQIDKKSLRDVCEQLRRTPVGIDGLLGKTVPQGVAFHHAGLTFDERDILEGAFRGGTLKVLVATSTLSSGVNLPARRVLIRTPTFHGALIDILTYKQMVGRAGRKGVDTLGESILVCKSNERHKALQLVSSQLPPVRSCLQRSVEEGLSSSMKRALLEVVVSGVASSPAEVRAYAQCTMLAASMKKELSDTDGEGMEGPVEAIEACIKFLQESEFITLRTVTDKGGIESDKFFPSQLGAAVLASALSPDEGLIVFKELQKARRSFVLENELHTIYLVTPIYMSVGSIDWYQYLCLWEQLDGGQRRVAEMVGISEAFLAKAVRGKIPQQTSQQAWVYNVHKRFYTCLVLNDLVNEMPLSQVASKYNCSRGVLQSLQQSAATFAGMVTVFCHKLGWLNLELLLSQFQSRLTFGVQRELVDLVRVSLLNGQRARVIYNGGFQTVAALANADPVDVEVLLKNSAPFMSKKPGEGESEWEAAERKKSQCIWLTGQKGLTEYEAAVLIVEEAKHWLQRDLEEIGVEWKPPVEKDNADAKKEKEILQLSIGPGKKPSGVTTGIGTAGNSSLNISSSKAESRKRHISHASGNVSNTSCSNRKTRTKNITNMSGNASILEKLGNVSVLSPPPSFMKTKSVSSTNVSVNSENKKRKQDVSHTSGTKQKGQTEIKSEMHKKQSVGAIGHTSEKKKSTDAFSDKGNQLDPKCLFNISGELDLSDIMTPPAKLKNTRKRKSASPVLLGGKVRKSPSEERLLSAGSQRKVTEARSRPTKDKERDSLQSKDWENGGVKSALFSANKKPEHSSNSSRIIVGEEISEQSCKDIQKIEKMKEAEDDERSKEEDLKVDNHEITSQSLVLHYSESMSLNECIIDEELEVEEEAQNNSKTIGSEQPCDLLRHRKVQNNQENEVASRVQEVTLPSMKQTDKITKRGPNEDVALKLSPETGAEEFCDSFMIDTQALNVIAKISPKYSTGKEEFKSPERPVDAKNSGFNRPAENVASPELYTENQEIEYTEPVMDPLVNGLLEKNLEKKKENKLTPNNSPPLYTEELGMDDTAMRDYMLDFRTQVDHVINSASPQLTGSRTGKGRCEGGRDVSQDDLIPASAFDKELEYQNFSYLEFTKTQIDDKILTSKTQGRRDTHANSSEWDSTCLRTSAVEIGEKQSKLKSGVANFGTISSSNERTDGGNYKCKISETEKHSKVTEKEIGDFSAKPQFSCTKMLDDDSLTFSMIEKCFDSEPLSSGTQRNSGNKNAKNPFKSSVISKANTNCDSHVVSSQHNTSRKDKKRSIGKSPSPKQKSNVSSQNINEQSPLVQFSPGMEDFLNAMIDQSNFDSFSNFHTQAEQIKETTAAVVKVSDKTVLKRKKSGSQRTKSSAKQAPSDNTGTKKARRKSSRQSVNSSLNDSNTSDCLPPTPTGSKHNSSSHMTTNTTPSRLIGGIGRTPTRSTPGSVKRDKVKSPGNGIKLKTLNTPVKGVREISTSKSTRKNNSNQLKTPSGQKRAKCDLRKMKTPSSSAKKKPSSAVVDLQSPSLPLTHQSFTIIDVCANAKLFKMFVAEWQEQKEFAISLACEKLPAKPVEGGGIGGNFQSTRTGCAAVTPRVDGLVVEEFDLRIVGLSITWSNRDAYYIALTEQNEICDLDESLLAPDLDLSLGVSERLDAVQTVLESEGQFELAAFDVKNQMRLLCQGCGIVLSGACKDPKVADWLLDPGGKEKNIHRMVHNYLPLEVHLLEGIGGGVGLSSLGLTPANPGSGRVRACIESVLVHHLTRHFDRELEKQGLDRAYREVEMSAIITLAKMEMNGMGFSQQECDTQKSIMQSKLTALEDQAYQLAGHAFSLSSTDDIAQVLFTELKLPPSGDPKNPYPSKTLGPARRNVRGRKQAQFSTAKDVLEKLKPLHPLPGIVLEWRRITSALTKVIFPLQKERSYNDRLGMFRIHGVSQSFTATGRVSMLEPNLQNIPKDFDIEMPGLIGESPTSSGSNQTTSLYASRKSSRKANPQVSGKQVSRCLPGQPAPSFSVSMRHAFVPFEGGVILAADYSQLELRVIAHLSNDKKLISILNGGGDVFKTIAAQWKGIEADQVTPVQRQQAKQVCYGMIYGIGAKALGEQLEVDENEASVFIESFKNKYTGMRSFLRDTVNRCREKGYVKTMMGRRRYLPAITDTNTHARAHAERQAVNTTVQGSAADLVKKAMVQIDQELRQTFPETRRAHLMHRTDCRQECIRSSRNRSSKQSSPEGAFFILQLHDELIYEVNRHNVKCVANIVRTNMEHAMKLHVVMPVKVSVGPTWGKLEEVDL